MLLWPSLLKRKNALTQNMNPEVVKPLLSSWRYAVPVFSVSAKTSYTLTVHGIADRTFPVIFIVSFELLT